jgi:hypothetical protein
MSRRAAALDLPASLIRVGARGERRAREAITAAATRAVIDGLDALLGSRLAEQVEQRVLDRVFAAGNLERVLVRAEAAEIPQRMADQLLVAGIADAIAARIVDGPELERIVVAALESPGAERIADRVVDSPSAERLVARIIESRLLDEAVARLLESEELWILVDEIARSPAVTEAISHQGAGLADEVAGAVRERSLSADDRIERVARRLLRRRPRDRPAVGPPSRARP